MGKLMKAFGKGTSAACVEDCDDSDGDPFVPNDFAEDDPFQALEEGQMDDPYLEKALYEFYVSHKVNCLKRKITNAGARNVISSGRRETIGGDERIGGGEKGCLPMFFLLL
ncbi:hypothetical protein VPH35_110779 [Triticum aestivum]|uniref:uncharacterized protein isoform X2 n=1 Tax=Triticum aestivum TaxID=4565 RepID=UPI001D013164|nr:uncharacterized protein LOC123137032 isoform X2 [Triticum aestivum]XP_044412509.1 uncharacterized protein LOC123137032 isoform X2 [Triticum aestivum]